MGVRRRDADERFLCFWLYLENVGDPPQALQTVGQSNLTVVHLVDKNIPNGNL